VSRAQGLLLSLLLVLPPVSLASPFEASITELQVAMARGELTSVALVDYYLDRIERLDRSGPTLNAIARVAADARTQARALDAERREQGPRGPLHGIPLVIKDNFETRAMATGAGSVLFEGFAPARDAAAVARLRAAGAVILAKTNMHEFAYGITTRGSAFGFTRNPYDRSRNPGGSSGGTAAAVAANLAVAGMGSDTCGSIRNPAAHNNLIGLRATQGLSSRRGIVPLSHTQDIGGPLARSAMDLALLLDATVGFDPEDPQTAAVYGQRLPGFVASLTPDALHGARIGVLEQAMVVDAADEPVARVLRAALRDMEALGATVVSVRLAGLEALLDDPADGFFVLSYDFHRDIDRYLRANPTLGLEDLDELIARGRHDPDIDPLLRASAAMGDADRETYLASLARREELAEALQGLMAREGLDALAYPTHRRTARPIGEPQPEGNCRLSANSGLPALSLPAGFAADGLPVGLELLGPRWSDARLLALAYALETAVDRRRPPDLPGDRPAGQLDAGR